MSGSLTTIISGGTLVLVRTKNVQKNNVLMKEIKTQTLLNVCEKRTYTAQLYGNSGALVVFLHGFPDTVDTFIHQVPALVEAGYRVLVPVLPGYEASSCDGSDRYFVSDLVSWLTDWLDQLGENKVHLVGHDWGAVIAWLVAASHPERCYSLTTIAIPSLSHLPGAIMRHPSQLFKSWYMVFFQLRGLSDRVVRAGNGWLIRQLWRQWSPDWEPPEDHLACVCRQLTQPAVLKATLAYYRCLFKVWDDAHRRGRRLLNRTITVPTLMICGVRDGCMDTRLFDTGSVQDDYPAGISLQRIDDAGHFCHLEKPRQVNNILMQFIDRHSPVDPGLASELAGHLG